MRRTNMASPGLGQQPLHPRDKVLPSAQPRTRRGGRRHGPAKSRRPNRAVPSLRLGRRRHHWPGLQSRHAGKGVHGRAGHERHEPKALFKMGSARRGGQSASPVLRRSVRSFFHVWGKGQTELARTNAVIVVCSTL